MDITCTKCQKQRPEEDFHWKNKKLGKRCPCCRDCKSEMQRGYYENNKKAYIAKIMETRAVRTNASLKTAKEHLLSHPCVDCGEADIRKLEFDHVRGKKKHSVSRMIYDGYSIDKVKEEIAKCEIRCGSCHMVKTWPNRWMLIE